MQKKFLFAYLLIVFTVSKNLKAQDTIAVSEVRVTAHLVKQSLLRTTEAASVIDRAHIQLNNSLVGAFNTVPGVRMEERSPGSYRLSLRGSLLRSPFGVRNVKVYLNEYPLTDAGGNTYINVLGMNAISSIEILKGPDGSLFGANSGGVVTIHTGNNTNANDAAGVHPLASLEGGSYGLFKENISLTKHAGKHAINVAQNYQRSDGYRENSKLHRMYAHLSDEWNYANNRSIKAIVFYSDLYYQTPGGLTQQQYDADPSQARPASPVFPGAVTQKAAVYNKMFFGGLTHTARLTPVLENVTAVFGSNVDFKNPFITNFEVRKENSYGARSFFIFSPRKNITTFAKWEYDIGAEWQQTRADIHNYNNNKGIKAGLIASGDIRSDQHFIFNKLKLDLNRKLIIEGGLSINYYSYRFKDSAQLSNNFKSQWMPRLGINYLPINKLTLRASVSRGYSPPTTAEIRPSDNNIYTGLQAETGINAELGIRYFTSFNRLLADLSVYHYELKNAIVRKQDAAGEEYFINAGGTNQKGLELQASYLFIYPAQNKKLFSKIQLSNSSSFTHFRFKDYIAGSANYSGNRITGVPAYNFVSSLFLAFQKGTYFFLQHNHTSSIPLNDANTVRATSYELMQLKAGHSFILKGSKKMQWYAGIDNLLNQRYSLGNDLNAAGSRYFNAAPLRNYFAGVSFSLF